MQERFERLCALRIKGVIADVDDNLTGLGEIRLAEQALELIMISAGRISR